MATPNGRFRDKRRDAGPGAGSPRQGSGKPSKREKFMQRTRDATQEALRSRDMLLANISRSIDDINRAANLMGERFEELYGIYFPELKLEDREKYIQMALILDKKNPDAKAISKIVGSGKANEIINSAQKSIGADLEGDDLAQCQAFAQQMAALYGLRDQYGKYLEQLAKEVCPNIAEVVGAELAAKLIAHVGSLARLSILPSSTIQVLGAERALFKHLKNKRIDPPKHGIIFQHVKISSSPKKVRGKIARLLANKIASAAKADQFTKRFIGPELRKELEERYAEIMANYQKEKGSVKGGPAQ